MIDFYEPRFEFGVDHYIKTHYLKTHRILEVVWLARSVGVRECWLGGDGSFNCDVLNFFHHGFCVESGLVLCHMVKYRCQ